ncbi:MAG: hypothetical protein HUU22_17050 [Phycisphaerae bacterium]|nr:hypothetical protein [Phycisphaerae bacterium]NUQ47730.1 hypothetical protein [Phycisphaerae bacterium]
MNRRVIQFHARRPALSPCASIACAALLLGGLCGCQTLLSIAIIVPSAQISLVESALLDAAVAPAIFADAGDDALATVNERVILDASASGVLLGSGSVNTDPTPPLSFAWSLVGGPIPDQDGDGDSDAADLIAAGGRLDFADTPFAQFSGPVAGIYTLRVTVSGTGRFGETITATDSVTVAVFDAAP